MVVITPMIGFLNQSEVSGRVPTPNGPIKVGWTLTGTKVAMTVDIPSGTTATLQLPAGAAVVGEDLHDGQLELSCGVKELTMEIQV